MTVCTLQLVLRTSSAIGKRKKEGKRNRLLSQMFEAHLAKQREQLKKPSSHPVKKKQRKDREPPLDKITYDSRPRTTDLTNGELKEIKENLAEFGCVAGYFINSDSTDTKPVKIIQVLVGKLLAVKYLLFMEKSNRILILDRQILKPFGFSSSFSKRIGRYQ